MSGVHKLAETVAATRRPVAEDNPFLALQTRTSNQIVAALDAYRAARDSMVEKIFFGFYGAPVVQAMLGIDGKTEVRPRPATSPEQLAAQQTRAEGYAAKLKSGGADAALTRAVMYVLGADRVLDQRCALALNAARQQTM